MGCVIDGEVAEWWGWKACSTLRLNVGRCHGWAVAHRVMSHVRSLPRFDQKRLGLFVMDTNNWDLDCGVSGLKWVDAIGGNLLLMTLEAMSVFRVVTDASMDLWDLRVPFRIIWGRDLRIKFDAYVAGRDMQFADYIRRQMHGDE